MEGGYESMFNVSISLTNYPVACQASVNHGFNQKLPPYPPPEKGHRIIIRLGGSKSLRNTSNVIIKKSKQIEKKAFLHVL